MYSISFELYIVLENIWNVLHCFSLELYIWVWMVWIYTRSEGWFWLVKNKHQFSYHRHRTWQGPHHWTWWLNPTCFRIHNKESFMFMKYFSLTIKKKLRQWLKYMYFLCTQDSISTWRPHLRGVQVRGPWFHQGSTRPPQVLACVWASGTTCLEPMSTHWMSTNRFQVEQRLWSGLDLELREMCGSRDNKLSKAPRLTR